MGLRHVAQKVNTNIRIALVLALVAAPLDRALAQQPSSSDGAQVRIATFESETGQRYFAASIQPEADQALMDAVSKPSADIAIVVDTSATQAGEFRDSSIEALRAVIGKLRAKDRVRIFAGDIEATDLSGDFGSAQTSDSAIEKLVKRLPLGNTNLMSVLDSVRASLVGQPQHRSRSIVYIGDGTSVDAMGDQHRFGAIVDALRADQIAIHSIAIGPATNVELMAVLANQTGGTVGIVGDAENQTPVAIGKHIGDSATMSPIWLTDLKLLDGMTTVHDNRLPPLRLDRDAIVLGKASAKTADGTINLTGRTVNSNISIVAEAAIEESHPDFAFLVGLVKKANQDAGLTLASAGSAMLRETARIMTVQSDELVKAGNLALQQGNKLGAKVVAEKALEADPNNPAAQALQRITGKRLVLQNESDDAGDIFGDGGELTEDPFGAVEADSAAPAVDDGMELDDAGDTFGDAPPPPPPADTVPRGIQPAPPAAADPGAAPTIAAPVDGAGFGDDELLDAQNDMLEQALIERRAAEGRLRNYVTGQLREAHRRLRINPTGVAGSLKGLLATVETTPDINPQLQQELESQVRSAVRMASRLEAEFREAQATLEQVAQGASASAQLLEETYRREATLKTLSQQINALIDAEQYTKADGEVTLPFAEIAGNSITRDSVAAHHFVDETLMLQTYDRDRRYRELRERNFVDAFSLVLKSNIPFVDEPPIHYPEADVWIKMSRRRLDRYGAIELIGDNETERRIQAALDLETSQTFDETPLVEAVREIRETHDIPIKVDGRALEEIGLSEEEPITIDLQNVSLRSFLRLMLRELDLTYLIQDEVMQITTIEKAEQNLVNKVYPVGDLVIPITSGGGGGGIGGGGGGFGGGGGGGFGGGGGGFGGWRRWRRIRRRWWRIRRWRTVCCS